MAFNAGSIEATLTLNRNPFTAGLQAARQQARQFAREKFEVNMVPRLDKEALTKVKAQVEKTVGRIAVRPQLDRTALQTVKSQVDRTIGRIQVRPEFNKAALTAIKAQIDKTIGRIQVRVDFDRAGLARAQAQIDRTVGRIQVRPNLDREMLQRIVEVINRRVARITVKVNLDRESLERAIMQISRRSATINIRSRMDRSVRDEIEQIIGSLNAAGGAAERFGNRSRNAGQQGERAFRGMDGTVRAVLMTLPLLLPVAGSAIVGVTGLLGALTSILGVAGVGMAAFGGVAISVFGKVKEGAALSRAEIAKLPEGIRQGANALKTLGENWDALVARNTAGVGLAMAAGFNAASAAVKTLDPIIRGMSNVLTTIGNQMTQYFGTEHWKVFVDFIGNNVGPVFLGLWDIIKYLTRGVMDLIVAFMPLGQWLLSSIADGMKSFAQWASTLAGNKEFQAWLELAKQSLISMARFIGVVIEFLFKLATALAPIGNKILDFLSGLFNALNKLPPEMLAAIAMGISGIFAALLLGAGGPVALAVGAVVGLAAAFMSLYDSSAPFKAAVDGVVSSLRDWLLPVVAQVVDAFQNKIKPAWDNLTAAVKSNLGPAFEYLGGIFQEKVLPALATLVETITSKVIPSILNFVAAVQPVVAFLVEVIGTALVNAIEMAVRIIDGAFKTIAGILDFFSALFTGNWSALWQSVKDIFTGLFTMVAGVFGLSLDEMITTLQGWGSSIVSAWNSLWSGVGNFFETTWNGIKNFFTTIWNDLVTDVGIGVDSILAFFRDLPNNIWYFLGLINGYMVRWVVEMGISIRDGLEAALEWFRALPEKIAAFMMGAETWLKQTGEDLWNGFTSGVENAWKATELWFHNLPDAIAAFLVGADQWVKDTGDQVIGGFLNGLKVGFEAVGAWFASLPDTISKLLTGADAWLLETGTNVVLGLWQGIENAWNGFTGWVAGLISSFIQGFKDGLGIASPSTIFAQIGMDIIQGLINGVQSLWATVTGFFTQLWQAIVGTVSTNLNQIISIVANIIGQVAAYWTQTWTQIKQFADNIWNAITQAWNVTLNGIRTILDAFVGFVSNVWNAFWQSIKAAAQVVWSALEIAWNGFLQAVQQVYQAFAALLSGNWQGFWDGIRNAAQIIWNAIQQAWQVLTTGLQNVYNAFSAYLSAAWQNFWNTVLTVAQGIWNTLVAAWTTITQNVTAIYQAFASFLSNAWNTFWNGIRTVAETVWNAITSFIENALINIRDTVSRAADQIGAVWRKVANFFRDPINWVIRVVVNDGILKGWNTVMGWIGAPGLTVKPLGEIPAFAKGGEVKKGRRGIANKDSIDARLMPGEYVFSKRAIANMGGLSAVDQIHQQARMGTVTDSPLAARSEGRTAQALMRAVPNMDDIMKMAYGGVMPHVAKAGDAVVRALGPMPGGIGGVGARANASDHPKGLALDFMTLGNSGLGDRVAGFLGSQWGPLAVKYLIWKQRIANSPGAWSGMEDRGSITANHFDHVHASFTGDGKPGGAGGGLIATLVSWWSILSSKVEGLFNGLLNFAGMPGNGSPIGNAITEVPKAMVPKVIGALRTKLENMMTSIFGGGGDAAAGSGPVVEQVRAVANGRGWGQGAQWDALASIIQRESGWNPTAQNPTSSAYGLFQFLDSTWGTVGGTKTANPSQQAEYGMRYIQQRYTDPVGAARFWNANKWYDDGGWLMPGPTIAQNNTGKPEAILTNDQWDGLIDGLNRLVGTGSASGGTAASNASMMAALNKLGTTMEQVRDLLEQRGFGDIIIYDKSGNPQETAREALLALRIR